MRWGSGRGRGMMLLDIMGAGGVSGLKTIHV